MAAAILALGDPGLDERLQRWRRQQHDRVAAIGDPRAPADD
jgi:hypothetical protein